MTAINGGLCDLHQVGFTKFADCPGGSGPAINMVGVLGYSVKIASESNGLCDFGQVSFEVLDYFRSGFTASVDVGIVVGEASNGGAV